MLEEKPGMALLQLALLDVVFGSEIEKSGQTWVYKQNGMIRAILGVEGGLPHGQFKIFYPTGSPWIEGSYNYGLQIFPWEVYLPNGERLPMPGKAPTVH